MENTENILLDIQQTGENRIKTLEKIEDLEIRLQGQFKNYSPGFKLTSDHNLTEEDRVVLEKSISIKELLFLEPVQAQPQVLSTGDGFQPKAGWNQNYYVLTTLSLSNEQTLNLIDLLKAGAGISSIVAAIAIFCGAVPIAVSAAIASALYVIGSSALAIRNRSGGSHGVYWKFTLAELILPAPVLAIHSQVYFTRHK